jgi:hypothetical protein
MKIAAYLGPDRALARAAVDRMLAAQRLRERQTPHVVEIPLGALGWLTTFDHATKIALARQADNGNLLLVSGVPVDLEGDLDARLARAVETSGHEAAEQLRRLDGAFAALHWDATGRTLTVVTDFIGMQPIYGWSEENTALLATELKGITASGCCRIEPDPLGWATLVALGHFAEDATSVKAVTRLPPSSITTYGFFGKAKTVTYWKWPEPRPDLDLDRVDTGELMTHFKEHLLSYEAHHGNATALVSGGFDSRLLVATLTREGRRPRGLILSQADEHDDANGRLAEKLARALRLEYERIDQSSEFYSSAAYLDYMVANEVATPSLNVFIAQLASELANRAEAVWEGVAPNYTFRTVRQETGGFTEFFAKKTAAFGPHIWYALRRVFAPAFSEAMEQALQELMQRAPTMYSNDEYGVTEFVTRSRMLNRTGPNPLKVYANDVMPFSPGLSKNLWEATGGIPFKVKADFALYKKVFRDHFPELRTLPFCSAGELHTTTDAFNPEISKIKLRGWLMSKYKLSRAIRGLGLRPPVVNRNPMLRQRVLERVDAGHPDLNHDGVVAILGSDPNVPYQSLGQSWLFYWQMWRWVMDGSLKTRQAALIQ